MAYDNPKYQVKQERALRKATFAASTGTTADMTATAAATSDRIQFFQKIKLTGVKAIPEVPPDAGSQTTDQAFKLILTDGSLVFARTQIGTVAGVMATGSIINANISAGLILYHMMAISDQRGTATTYAPGAMWSWLEYQERF